MRLFQLSLLALSSLWVASEIGLAILKRGAPGTASKDAGTLRLLNLVIYASVTLALFLSRPHPGPLRLPQAILWAGFALIAIGLVLRWWAVLSLRQFFTVDVVIQPNHQLITRGPYRWLRHPAYAGSLFSFLGLAVCTSNWLSALVLSVPIASVFLYRVRVEERALREAFPEAYDRYASHTDRLIPGVF